MIAMPRREFLRLSSGLIGMASLDNCVDASSCLDAQAQEGAGRPFRLWAMGCSHVGTDLRRGRRQSLAEAIQQADSGGPQDAPPFGWDVAVHLGDLSGAQGAPDDDEGAEIVRQFGTSKQHARECFYNLAGNHDASLPGQPSMAWYRKWIDPEGDNARVSGVDPKNRPYPIEGTWERYAFRVGNILFLMMSDRNDGGPPIGRGERGGYPAGAVTGETFRWWQQMVATHSDSVIISAHHHMLRETTFASGPYEGMQRLPNGQWRSHYHGYFPAGAPQGASYLYFVDGKPDARAFEHYLAERYLAQHEGAIDLWLGGHTHSHPDDTTGGRSHVETKWGVHFINCAGLTRYHTRIRCPMSRLLTFTEGSRHVRVQCYLHTADYAPQGWYAQAERTIELGRPFRWT